MKSSIVLLSGGLDSLTSLSIAVKKTKVKLCLTFDYGQRAAKDEINAAHNICKYYNLPHKVIKLDWLSYITKTALVNKKAKIPSPRKQGSKQSAKAVWVPNRNAVFIAIAASYAESLKAGLIITGFNAEEAQTFPDNSKSFVSASNRLLKYSTLFKPQIVSFVQKYNKKGIVNLADKYSAPYDLIYSCYNSSKNGLMCGTCESCQRLKKALKVT